MIIEKTKTTPMIDLPRCAAIHGPCRRGILPRQWRRALFPHICMNRQDTAPTTSARLFPCLWVAIAVLAFSPGCGRERLAVPIQGEVTFNGKPVEEGTISLEPADGKGVTTGGKIVDGKYQLTGIAAPSVGKKLVRISAVRKTGRKVRGDSFSPAGTMVDEIERYLPDVYNTRSTLSCEVSADASKQIDFHLKSP